MNQEHVRSTAEILDNLLKRYASTDKEAAILQSTIQEVLSQALNRQVQVPLAFRDVPGDRFILESHLMQTHRDLTDAFMLFKLAVTDN